MLESRIETGFLLVIFDTKEMLHINYQFRQNWRNSVEIDQSYEQIPAYITNILLYHGKKRWQKMQKMYSRYLVELLSEEILYKPEGRYQNPRQYAV